MNVLTYGAASSAPRGDRRQLWREHRRAIRNNNTVAVPPGRRLDVQARHTINGDIVRRAIAAVDAAGVAQPLDAHLHGHQGSRSVLRARAILVVAILAADDACTQERTDFAATAASLPPWARFELGLYNPDGSPPSYRVWEKQTGRFVKALHEGWCDPSGEFIDAAWLRQRLTAVCVPSWRLKTLTAVALDGTPLETWAVTRAFGKKDEFLDPSVERLRRWAEEGVDPEEDPSDGCDTSSPAPSIGELGADDKAIRSKDVEARTSWATGTNNRSGHYYTGWEVHLAVAVKTLRWAGDPRHMPASDAVPSYIVGADVTPAGSHRGAAGIRAIDMAEALSPGLREVIADLGYTHLVKPGGFLRPLHERGFNVVMDFSKAQRARGESVLIGGEVMVMNCGHVLHSAIPPRLRRIAGGPRSEDDREEWTAAMELHAERAQVFRWGQHQRYPDGAVRFQCPFEQGRAANPDLCSRSISAKSHVPQVAAPKGMERCCGKPVVRATVEQLDLYQVVPYGTPAWAESYGRRNAVEGVNGQLEVRFQFRRGFVKVFGNAAADFAVTAEIAAYDLRLAEYDSDPASVEGSEGVPAASPEPDAGTGKDAHEPVSREIEQRGPPG